MDRDFLCDADVLSLLQNPDPEYARLKAWWGALPAHRRIMAGSTYDELLFGPNYLEKRNENPDPVRAAVIRQGIEELRLEMRTMPIADEVVAEYSSLRAEPSLECLWRTDQRRKNQKKPKVKSGGDVWLAAFSRVTGIVIASRNERDFLRIQEVAALPGVYNPVDKRWVVRAP